MKNLDANRYNRLFRPNQGTAPVRIKVSAHITQLHDVDEANGMAKVTFYLRQSWNDSRLSHASSSADMIGGSWLLSSIWKPDTFFSTSVHGQQLESPSGNHFVRVSSSGEVLFSMRTTQAITCRPRDSFDLVCTISIESYGHSAVDMTYQWSEYRSALGIDEQMYLPQHVLIGRRLDSKQVSLSSGSYSIICADLFLMRRLSGLVYRFFAPIALVTAASFATFAMHQQLSAARFSVTVAAAIATPIVSAILMQQVPQHGPVASLCHTFSLSCIVFALASLSHELWHHAAAARGAVIVQQDHRQQQQQQHQQQSGKSNKRMLLLVKEWAKSLGLPIAFLIFLVVYAFRLGFFTTPDVPE